LIEIGPHQFPTKDAAKAYIRSILARYTPGDLVEGEDHKTLIELTLRHPRSAEKVGAGVDRFRVILGPYGRSRAYEILRSDGTKTDISFPKCVDGDPPHRTLVLRSLRFVVEPDVNALRQLLFRDLIGSDGRLPCEMTGARLLPTEGHLDHIAPHTFLRLVTMFLEAHGLDIDTVPLAPSRDGEIGRRLLDAQLADLFRSFHAHAARLRFIAARENLSLGSRIADEGHRIS
jgi:hypothetical protein